MANWKKTALDEVHRAVYEEELKSWLPDRILDFHVHVFHEQTIPAGGEGFALPGVSLRSYTIPELQSDLEAVYPGKETAAVVFGFPDAAYDFEENNRYVAENSDCGRVFPFRLVRPDEDPEALDRDLRNGNFLGVKPYLCYVQGKGPEEIEILDMIPHRLMEVIDGLGSNVMLHVPRGARLADPVNQAQIKELALTHKNARIILAHIGRAYYLKNITGWIEPLQDFENLYVDTAMLNNWEVIEYLLGHFDHSRIIYGTDMPISLCGGKSVEINDQYTYVTSEPWPLSISDDHGKLVFTSFLYEELRAVKKAGERAGVDGDFHDKFFWNNGMNLLEKAQSRREQ